MDLMPLDRLGARQNGQGIDFGVLLPSISAAAGYTVTARIIHEHDQFLQAIPAVEVALQHQTDADYGDYWSGTAQLDAGGPVVGISHGCGDQALDLAAGQLDRPWRRRMAATGAALGHTPDS